MQWVINLIVSLFNGWLGERSRDKAHEDKGRTEAQLQNEAITKNKIQAASDAANVSIIDGLPDDPNNRDN